MFMVMLVTVQVFVVLMSFIVKIVHVVIMVIFIENDVEITAINATLHHA